MSETESIEVLMLTRRSKGPADERLIYTEEVITEIFCKMVQGVDLKVCECEDSILDESDELFGQFPVLIYKHYIIPRKYILEFWKVATDIDG